MSIEAVEKRKFLFIISIAWMASSSNASCPPCTCHRTFRYGYLGVAVDCSNLNLSSIPDTLHLTNGSIYLFHGNPDLRLLPSDVNNFVNMQVLTLPEKKVILNSSFSANKQLKVVRFPDTTLTDVSPSLFESNAVLKIIENLHVNEIPPQFLHSQKGLVKLSATTNQEVLPVDLLEENSYLEEFSLTANFLTDLPGGLLNSQRKTLTKIYLHVDSIRSLPGEFFNYTLNLKEITISGQSLELTTPFLGTGLAGLTLNLNHINTVSYTALSNSMYTISTTLQSVQTVICNPDFSIENYFMDQLTIVDCNISLLPDGCIYRLSRLKTANFSDSQIRSVQLAAVSQQDIFSLTSLDLSYNEIQTLPSENLLVWKNLQELNLSNNNIELLSNTLFSHSHNLKTLKISHNHIEILPEGAFENLIKLENLDLSHNNIKLLPPKLFQNLLKLRYISLRGNSITTLEAELIFSLEITSIDLSYNNIIYIDYRFLSTSCSFAVDFNVDLSGNDHLFCGCSLSSLSHCLGEDLIGECYTPIPLRGRSLGGLRRDDVCNDEGNDRIFEASRFISNGSHIRVEMDAFVNIYDWFLLRSLKHNGRYFEHGSYILRADVIYIDPSGHLISLYHNVTVFSIQTIVPTELLANGLAIMVISEDNLYIPTPNKTVNVSDDEVAVISFITVIVRINQQDTRLAFSYRDLSITAGDVQILIIDLQDINYIEMSSEGFELVNSDKAQVILLTLPVSKVNLTSNGSLIVDSSIPVTYSSPADTSAMLFFDGTALKICFEPKGCIITIKIPGAYYLLNNQIEFHATNMSVYLDLFGEIQLNNSHIVIREHSLVKAVLVRNCTSLQWNNRRVICGKIAIESQGKLFVTSDSIFIHDPNRKLIIERSNMSAIDWNTTHIRAFSEQGYIESVFNVPGIPIYEGNSLVFVVESVEVAKVYLNDSYPIFDSSAIYFHGDVNLQLVDNGVRYINETHIISQKAEGSEENPDEIFGVYVAHGNIHFNTTHIVKTSDEDKLSSVLGVSPSIMDRSSSVSYMHQTSTPAPKLTIHIFVSNQTTCIQFPSPIQLKTFPAVPFFDGAGLIYIGSTVTLATDGQPEIFNHSSIVFDNELVLYNIDLDEISKVSYKVNRYVTFTTWSGLEHFRLALEGEITIVEDELRVRNTEERSEMILQSLFDNTSVIYFSGFSTVSITPFFEIDCGSKSYVELDVNILHVKVGDTIENCLSIDGIIRSSLTSDSFLHVLYGRNGGVLNGTFKLDCYPVIGTSDINCGNYTCRPHCQWSNYIQPGGSLAIINGSLLFYEKATGHASMTLDLSNRLFVRANSTVQFVDASEDPVASSDVIIDQMLYNGENLLLKSNGVNWLSIHGPLIYRITLGKITVVPLQNVVDGDAVHVEYFLGELSAELNLSVREGLSQISNSLLNYTTYVKQMAFGTGTDDMIMYYLDDLTIITNEEILNGILCINITKTELSVDKYTNMISKEGIVVLIDTFRLIPYIHKSRLAYIDDDGVVKVFHTNAFDGRNMVVSLHGNITFKDSRVTVELFESDDMSRVVIEDDRIYFMNDVDVITRDFVSRQRDTKAIVKTDGFPNFNGSSINFLSSDGQLEAAVILDSFPNITFSSVRETIVYYLKDQPFNVTVNIKRNGGPLTINQTHFIYGSNGESIFVPGAILITNEAMTIAGPFIFETPHADASVLINGSGITITYTYSDFDEILTVLGRPVAVCKENNFLLVRMNRSRDVTIYFNATRQCVIDGCSDEVKCLNPSRPFSTLYGDISSELGRPTTSNPDPNGPTATEISTKQVTSASQTSTEFADRDFTYSTEKTSAFDLHELMITRAADLHSSTVDRPTTPNPTQYQVGGESTLSSSHSLLSYVSNPNNPTSTETSTKQIVFTSQSSVVDGIKSTSQRSTEFANRNFTFSTEKNTIAFDLHELKITKAADLHSSTVDLPKTPNPTLYLVGGQGNERRNNITKVYASFIAIDSVVLLLGLILFVRQWFHFTDHEYVLDEHVNV